MFDRLRRLFHTKNEITRKETVGGIKFVYHGNIDEPLAAGWVDKKRVIHLVEPRYLVDFVKNHELAHHHRWNKPTMRIYRFMGLSLGSHGIILLILAALGLYEILSTSIPLFVSIGLILLYWVSAKYEEYRASREAKKMMKGAEP